MLVPLCVGPWRITSLCVLEAMHAVIGVKAGEDAPRKVVDIKKH